MLYFCSASDNSTIFSRTLQFLRRCDKLGYTDKHYSAISTKFQEADDALFRSILSNTSHVLHTSVNSVNCNRNWNSKITEK